MTITFTEYGAAECIEGSKGILQINDRKHLIDCGKSYQVQSNSDTQIFPFNVKEISDTFVTHAHGDHVGELLELVYNGFNGKIFSTYQTAEITKQQIAQEASSVMMYNNSIKGRKFESGPHEGEYIPFKKSKFKYADVTHAMSLFETDRGVVRGDKKGFAYNKPLIIDDNLTATFYDAGHIPGSAQILFDIHSGGKNTTVLTACDLGRTDYFISNHPVANIPIVKAPVKDFPKPIDHIILEATYGAKVHKPLEESIDMLYDAIQNTTKNNGGLIIPAFSIMRTHLLSVILYDFYKSGKLSENLNMYISSPGADSVSKIIMAHPEDMDAETFKKFQNKNDNPFWFSKLVHHEKYAETQKVLTENKTPYLLIGASGMCDMGRIVDILKNTISNPNNTIALLGYQAEHTRGRKLLDKEEYIRFGKELVPLKADVINVSGFSGHVDCVESIAHLKYINSAFPGHSLKSINIKHGEKEQCYALAAKVKEAGFSPNIIRVLKKGESVTFQ